MRRIFCLTSILLLTALFTGPVPAQGETIVVGIDADALTLDPHNFRHRETETILRNMYDGFVTRTPDMVVVPELAETLDQLDDLTWEITIREGVVFHDGTPLQLMTPFIPSIVSSGKGPWGAELPLGKAFWVRLSAPRP